MKERSDVEDAGEIVTDSADKPVFKIDSDSDMGNNTSTGSDTEFDIYIETTKENETKTDIDSDSNIENDKRIDTDTGTEIESTTETSSILTDSVDTQATDALPDATVESTLEVDTNTGWNSDTHTETDVETTDAGEIEIVTDSELVPDQCCGKECNDCTAHGHRCNPEATSCIPIPCSSDFNCDTWDYICNEKWGFCVVANCIGRDNFTRCETVVVPDRAYDICVDETCVSPGCGDSSCNVPGPNFPLADTNQRDCYDESSEILCSASTEPFYGQDAQYGWDFVYAATQRFSYNVDIVGQPSVADNVTGLIWQGCPADITGNTCTDGDAGRYAWEEALSYCDELVWAGYSDWRLPDMYALDTIVDSGRTGPSIDVNTKAFQITPTSAFWSSSTFVGDSSLGKLISFNNGYIVNYAKGEEFYVRCVRGGKPQSQRFVRDSTVANEPVISDRVTGLYWQGCVAGVTGELCENDNTVDTQTWSLGLSYCQSLIWGGHSDWRTPNRMELTTIMSNVEQTLSIDTTVFPGSQNEWLASSSTFVGDVNYMWAVDFNSGEVNALSKTIAAADIRCVRGGI